MNDQMERPNEKTSRWIVIVIVILIVVVAGIFVFAGRPDPEGDSEAERQQYTTSAESQIKQFKEDLAEITSARAAGEEEGQESDPLLDEEIALIERQLDQLAEMLPELRQAGAAEWEELQPQFQALLEGIESAFQRVRTAVEER
jgi:uncharacterized protein YicC (UPF0701 family)